MRLESASATNLAQYMDRDQACVLLLGLPKATFCGIDLLSFTTSPRFHGIKHVPKGWHFLFTGTSSTFSVRHGLWLEIKGSYGSSPEILIFQWSTEIEALIAESDEQTVLKWRANLGSIWRDCLTPYRQRAPSSGQDSGEEYTVEMSGAWPKLTDCVSKSLLERAIQSPGNDNNWIVTSASSALRDADDIPGLTKLEAFSDGYKELQFLPIDLRRTWRDGAVGRERSDAAQDRSWAFGDLVQRHCDHPLDVIGELQLTFLMVLTINNYSCLEQWKRILTLLLTCRSATIKQTSFFVQFLDTLRLQLEHCGAAEGGLFDLSDDGAPLLKSLMRRFRQGLEEQPDSQAKADVVHSMNNVEEYLELEHGFLTKDNHVKKGTIQLEDGEIVQMDMNGLDEQDETGDFAPTIVIAPELARQLGIGSEYQLTSEHEPPSMLEMAQEDVVSDGEDDNEKDIDLQYQSATSSGSTWVDKPEDVKLDALGRLTRPKNLHLPTSRVKQIT